MALAASGLTTHIYNNNIKSGLLLMSFPVLIFAMIYAFYVGLIYFGFFSPQFISPAATPADEPVFKMAFYHLLDIIPYIIGGVAIWFIIAWFFHSRMIRAATGAVPVTRDQYPKIYNMLENLCISRGIPMPKFQIIDSPALNAFASGINTKTYSITLTRGIVNALEDDELEAVIAHELSHIRNRDVRLMIIAIIFVGIISFTAKIAFRSMIYGRYTPAVRYGGGRRQGNNGGILIILLGFAILAVGYMFAILIRFAISRKREYLADAGAVELTKNPSAMMRALMRISKNAEMKDIPVDVKQMCIENAGHFMGMFATHPPIEQRIQTLSDMTNTPIPHLPVSLKRPPKRPWG